MHEEDKSTIDAVDKVMPGVVSIVMSKLMSQLKQMPSAEAPPFGGLPAPEEFNPPAVGPLPDISQDDNRKVKVGGGSGFIVESSGIILTNKHVVFDSQAEYTVITNDEKEYPAKILTRDPINDIAILKIDGKGFSTVNLGKANSIVPGQTVMAIGNALGLFSNTVSKGIVSGLSRQISAAIGQGQEMERLRGVIQTDVAINQGNSGGPLINLDGEVVGINTAVIFGAQNIGFAIPIERATKDLGDLRDHGRIISPYIGLRYLMLTPEIKEAYSLEYDHGALVIEDHVPGSKAVIPDSPADKAGLQVNDVIIGVDGKKLDKKDDMSDIIQKHEVGDILLLSVIRKRKIFDTHLKLEERK